ncbi:phosphoribosylamine--glycine ligase [Microlunatus endophyticus]
MSVLVVGNGAREHAIALALSRDPEVGDLYVAPGNPGTAAIAENRAVDADNPAAVAALATELGVDLVVVGPEAPLVAGVADAVRLAGIPVFGPNAAAARIEGSKAFAKEIMTAAGVPTAAAVVCTDAGEARQALEEFGAPYVVKDDGLAAGKGVIVTDDLRAAIEHAAHCGRVVIEEFLDGPEVSLFAFVDGRTVVPLQPAQDFKRAHDDDQGPNTGGWGRTPFAMGSGRSRPAGGRHGDPADGRRVGPPRCTVRRAALHRARVDQPRHPGGGVQRPVRRSGDPAAADQARHPLGGVLYAAATGKLADLAPLRWKPGAAVGVVLASEGYPEQPVTGRVITGLDDVPVPVLQAGTSTDDRGQLVSSGGRVLTVVGLGEDLHAARDQAYAEIAKIKLEGAFYRTDIALAAAEGKVEIRS